MPACTRTKQTPRNGRTLRSVTVLILKYLQINHFIKYPAKILSRKLHSRWLNIKYHHSLEILLTAERSEKYI